MALQTFTQNMLRLGTSMGLSRGFSSFLEVAIAMNTSDRDEPFRSMLIRYDKLERYLLMDSYASLVLEMTGDGSGLIDVLGEFFCRYIGNGRHITDQKYYDMLPGLFRSDMLSYRIADYGCQTGRRLLAAAKLKLLAAELTRNPIPSRTFLLSCSLTPRQGRRGMRSPEFNRNLRFFCADSDITMCRITLLNLCLNGLFGEVAWFDVKNDLFFSAWSVDLDYKGKLSIRKIVNEKSLLFQKRNGQVPDTTRLIFNF